MATRSDELTTEIETTRRRMDQTLDEFGRRAGPRRMRERFGNALGDVRDTVMGVVGDVRERAAGAAAEASEGVRRQSQGSPLAAGLVAFGGGLLVGSLLPESRAEQTVAQDAQRQFQGRIREEVSESVHEVTERVGERTREAKDELAEEVHHAAEEVREDVKERAESVGHHAEEAAEEVRHDVEDSVRHHTGG